MEWKKLLSYVTGSVDRIQGAVHNLGYTIRDQTVANILQRHGIVPAPERRKQTTWKEFIRAHREVLAATDFFRAEVWSCAGLITYYVLVCIRLQTRQVHLAGITSHRTRRSLGCSRWRGMSPWPRLDF